MSVPSVAVQWSSVARLPIEVTSYVGREAEMREVKRLLGTAALVTLTGPGGVGKTRLALQVATSARASFDDVVFVGLAELREPKLLVNTVIDRLGLSDRSTRSTIELVIDHLRERRLLLVLDNCEHLVDVCAWFVDAVLTSCPGVVVLATSRQSLGVSGEQVMPVPPLPVPEQGGSFASLDTYDAIRLFVERASAVVPSFALTEENFDDVVRLCRALDGLPLAIELAAVRLRSLSARQLAERLNRRFTLLTQTNRSAPTRHETLESLIDWSYQLCTEQERLLWARASVFSGSFHLDAVESVCHGDGLEREDMLDVLDGLIDKSILVREEHPGQARYRMLETIRQYGEDRLRLSGDLRRVRRWHRDWCLELCDDFSENWFGPNQADWINRVDHDHANLRQALNFCLADPDEAQIGLRMVTDVKFYWIMRGLIAEGRTWCRRLLDAAEGDTRVKAKAGWIDAFLALIQGDEDAYQASLRQASEIAERIGDDSARAYVHHVRGYSALMGADYERATELFGRAGHLLRKQGDVDGELWSTYNYGLALVLAGDLEGGRVVLRDCIDRYIASGEMSWRSWALWSLSAAEYLAGDIDLALGAGMEVLRLQRQFGDRAVIAFNLIVMAGCATHRGEYLRAARVFGASTSAFRLIGAMPNNYAAFDEGMARDIATVTGALGVEAAAAEFMAGAAMSIDDAIAYALGDAVVPTVVIAPAAAPLTKREMQVAELVAKGMTNREIAKVLVISLRTAETHIDHIRTKLGFSNRAQIAAWVASAR